MALPNAKLATELDIKWKPIFRKMIDAPGVKPIPDDVDETFVQSSFTIATEYLKSTLSYIWKNAKDEAQVGKYSIATWSKKVACSEILKHGTPEDIVHLPSKTACNCGHRSKRGGWNIEKSGVRRVSKSPRQVIVDSDPVNE